MIVEAVGEMESKIVENEERTSNLIITDEELREFLGTLNPVGEHDIKIEVLERLANDYRLKALNEHEDKRKEKFYRGIHDVARQKIDLLNFMEGREPEGKISKNIIREVVDNNETVIDLRRLEKF